MTAFIGHTATWNELMARRSRLPSSLIFSGADGVGKRLVAFAFARELTGETRSLDLAQPFAQTESVLSLSPDGSQIKIEQVRDVLRYLSLARDGRPVVIVFNDAHLLNPQAGNALLKVIEEPPPNVTFIFIAPSSALLLATIRSRSQVVRFAPLTNCEVRRVLQNLDRVKAVEAETAVFDWVLEAAAGSPGRAIELSKSGETAMDLMPLVDALLASVCDFAKKASERTQALADLRSATKEREAHEIAIRLVGRRLVQAWRDRAGAGAQGLPRTLHWLSELRFNELDDLTELGLQLERDLKRNVDRQLLWEAFASRASRRLAGEALGVLQ